MNQAKRVAVYTDDPDEGGVAAYNHAILCGLAARGYQPVAIQSESASPRVAEQRAAGVEHHWLGFHTRRDPVRNATRPEDAHAAFDATRPDVVLFANCSPFSHVAAKAVAKARNIPFVVVEGYVAPLGELNPEAAWYLHHLGDHYQAARAVIAVSQENLALLRQSYRLHARKGEVVHYGRPASFFDPVLPEVRQRLRAELGLAEGDLLTLTVARLEPVKGYEIQLRAIQSLKASPHFPRMHFAWVGAGTLEAGLRQRLEQMGVGNQVHLLGQRWDVPDLLGASDLFLLPSHYEGMPLVIMEAMARGLPVIASAVSGIPEEVGDAGVLLPSPNADPVATATTLTRALHALAGSPEKRQAIGQAARKRACAMFREERMIHQTVQVIERALLPRGDYVSPGFEVVRPDAAFPNMAVGDPERASWEYLRRGLPHNWYVDGRAPDTGFANRDEASILYNSARRFAGQRGLEIGCWLGWSLTHIALGGVQVDVIDPGLAREDFVQNIEHALTACGVRDRVRFVPGFSPAEVVRLQQEPGARPWPFIFIDGNHDAPYPVFDAAVCAQHAAADALILFHDLASPEVADGLEYLRQCGWETMVYMTSQIMGVAWRGSARPVEHVPDPEVAWHLPQHLRRFRVSGM